MASEPCPLCGSTAGPDHPCPGQLIGKVLDDRYQIESVLGQGGMGMVFRAIQIAIKRPVAVKTLNPSLAAAPQFFERFRREAEIASRLRHPNIITIFDFGRAADGTCYFVMELVPGESLRQLVKREGPLSIRRAANIIDQAARGLAHAHQENVVHRDIKPHNLLVSTVDGADFVKILDFGLVKALEMEEEEQLTTTGQVLGTPQYMPPEQAGGEVVDQRSDLYSLGGVFYFCLTGTSPFGANTVRKALTAALTQKVPPLASHRKGAPAPRALDELFRKALAPDKENRYQSAEELVADMREAIAGLSDDELDARPEHGGDAGKDPSGSKAPSSPSQRGKTPSRAAGSSTGRGEKKVIVSQRALGDADPRSTSPDLPSLRPAQENPEPTYHLRKATVRRLLVAAPLLLLAAGAAAVLGLRSPSAPQDSSPVAPAKTERPAAPAPPPSDTVIVTIRSAPGGAEVLDGDLLLGKTPVDVRLTRHQLHPLTFRLEGHVPHEQTLDLSGYPQATRHVDVELKPLPREAPRPSRKKKDAEDIPVFE